MGHRTLIWGHSLWFPWAGSLLYLILPGSPASATGTAVITLSLRLSKVLLLLLLTCHWQIVLQASTNSFPAGQNPPIPHPTQRIPQNLAKLHSKIGERYLGRTFHATNNISYNL